MVGKGRAGIEQEIREILIGVEVALRHVISENREKIGLKDRVDDKFILKQMEENNG